MKNILFALLFTLVNLGVAQEAEEEFIPIQVEDKDAFMSTKTGEYTFRSHADTDPQGLSTTAKGVVYTEVSTYLVKAGESLGVIAKKYKLSLSQLKKDNKLKSNALSIGQKLKIVKKTLVKSSSPVISYVGESRVIASLRPGESPATLAPPPPPPAPKKVEKAFKKTQAPNMVKHISRKGTYSKPMIIPQTTTKGDKEKGVVAATNDDGALEDLKKQLELAKPKVDKIGEEKNSLEQLTVEPLEKNEPVAEVTTEELVEKAVKSEVLDLAEDTEKITSVKEEVVKEVEGIESVVEKEAVKASLEEESLLYTVVGGDTLYGIARRNKITVSDLKKLNNLKTNNLKIGQKLKIK